MAKKGQGKQGGGEAKNADVLNIYYELKDLTPDQNTKFATEKYEVLMRDPNYLAEQKKTKLQTKSQYLKVQKTLYDLARKCKTEGEWIDLAVHGTAKLTPQQMEVAQGGNMLFFVGAYWDRLYE